MLIFHEPLLALIDRETGNSCDIIIGLTKFLAHIPIFTNKSCAVRKAHFVDKVFAAGFESIRQSPSRDQTRSIAVVLAPEHPA